MRAIIDTALKSTEKPRRIEKMESVKMLQSRPSCWSKMFLVNHPDSNHEVYFHHVCTTLASDHQFAILSSQNPAWIMFKNRIPLFSYEGSEV